ncbi:MAG: hypothetical protein F6J98_22120 [Moorea sp. SIO4G2]|uniref:hypothetical protein n=1 Tax=Moorena sp. SIO3E8 TaxID=2607830 RepID=UPI0013FAB7DE|nr:hypothetical protein [Moorena sp. SIO3E8]NEO11589.1 hypothetical protein [Moorena sp. SIO3E8]NEO62986.1 hypothetical protein [Moorena sp. SIO4G2]NEP99720.1 hypothetical protein [Moorena sp. SIO3F7]
MTYSNPKSFLNPWTYSKLPAYPLPSAICLLAFALTQPISFTNQIGLLYFYSRLPTPDSRLPTPDSRLPK